jgi:hypothetical protein
LVFVYVDDVLLMAQTSHQRTMVLRSALHPIDDVFQPLMETEPPTPNAPKRTRFSEKDGKGDACWSTTKRILGGGH